MWHLVAQRLIQAGVVLLAVSFLVVVMLRLIPGDPAQLLAGPEASIEVVEQIRRNYALDRSIPVQYVAYVSRAVQGDFGRSLRTRRPVMQEIVERYPATLQLALTSIMLAIVVGVPLGLIAGSSSGARDAAISTFTTFGISMPGFWLGLVLMSIFSLHFGLLPVAGRGTYLHLVLPSVTLATPTAAFVARLVRAQVREELFKDYVRVGRSKGLQPRVLLFKHVMRNALLPLVTLLGIEFGRMLGGAVVVESVFAWPGLGRLVLLGIESRDYPLVQAAVLWLALTFVIVNAAVDFAYVLIDPRIRYA
jgi:peptide/nickel transport system permease protein